MKDLSTGKSRLTRRTREVAGPVFAKAGYNVEALVDERQILAAWSQTLSDAQADDLLSFVTGKRLGQSDAAKAAPSTSRFRVVK